MSFVINKDSSSVHGPRPSQLGASAAASTGGSEDSDSPTTPPNNPPPPMTGFYDDAVADLGGKMHFWVITGGMVDSLYRAYELHKRGMNMQSSMRSNPYLHGALSLLDGMMLYAIYSPDFAMTVTRKDNEADALDVVINQAKNVFYLNVGYLAWSAYSRFGNGGMPVSVARF